MRENLKRDQPSLARVTGEAARRALAATIDARSRRSPQLAGVVLMFHEIARTSGDPHRSVVPALGIELLRAQLAHLRQRYEVVAIRELQDRVVSRAPGHRFPVALTFDDDLECHRTLVAPLLSELGLPATFFLTGSSLDGPQAFWWHDLNDLSARGGEDWQEVRRECEERWGSTGRDVDLHALARSIEMMPPDDRDAMARRLREISARPPSDRGLSESAVGELVAEGFEIGFHTRAHYQLQTLDDDALRTAMREGRERLSAIAGQELTTVAYPHGHADLRIAAAAADAGFKLGFVWSNLPVGATSHPLLLDRVDAWQHSAPAFAFRLARTISTAR